MSSIEIIRSPATSSDTSSRSTRPMTLFGKAFLLAPAAETFRISLHEDFPLIDEDDLAPFIDYCRAGKSLVISGCEARIHPFRLMYIDAEGFDGHLADIPQSMRGNRHLYPTVYSFVPALMGIPPGIRIDEDPDPGVLELYVMPPEKLLDQSVLSDSLLIKALRRKPGSLGSHRQSKSRCRLPSLETA